MARAAIPSPGPFCSAYPTFYPIPPRALLLHPLRRAIAGPLSFLPPLLVIDAREGFPRRRKHYEGVGVAEVG